jgi:hypothetical protein
MVAISPSASPARRSGRLAAASASIDAAWAKST